LIEISQIKVSRRRGLSKKRNQIIKCCGVKSCKNVPFKKNPARYSTSSNPILTNFTKSGVNDQLNTDQEQENTAKPSNSNENV
jgi:hypothetical protein